jgi:thiol-disulfide isomerase/thioredoxin
VSVGKVLWVTLLAGSVSIGLALFGERWLQDDQRAQAPRPLLSSPEAIADTLPDLRLPDLEGREISGSSWAGKVLVLNFWATWCPPCLREMPLLDAWQQRYGSRGLQIVGIAIDRPDDVARFLAENAVSYPILIGNIDTVGLSKRLGNRTGALPFTVVFDPVGRRVFSHTGELSRALLEAEITPQLAARD